MGGSYVLILMACYNGARYLEEQIQSIQAQSYRDWILIARDDGSRDETRAILRRFESEDPRICTAEDGDGNLGPIGNFSRLISYACEKRADYIFFADQDDVWHPAKLEIMLSGMRDLEATVGGAHPLLVHCDLAVADVHMQVTAPSFMGLMRLSPESADLGSMLVQNHVTGCACLVNRMALELANPMAPDVPMHDWWLALLCSATGKVGYLPRTLVNYRQHGANVVGAKVYWKRLAGLLSLGQWRIHLNIIRRGLEQAKWILDRIESRKINMLPGAREQLDTYSTILDAPLLFRASLLRKFRIHKPSMGREVLFKTAILIMRQRSRTDTAHE